MEGEQNQETWSFHQEDATNTSVTQTPTLSVQDAPVTWTGSEFVAKHKDGSWYVTLAAGILILCTIVFFTVHDYIAIAAITVVGLLFGVLAGQKPRQLSYMIDGRGITIGDKLYPYGMFKSFAMLKDGAIGHINLLPLKRFMPEISVYYAPDDEERIFEALAQNLPNEQRQEQSIDRLMKRLKF